MWKKTFEINLRVILVTGCWLLLEISSGESFTELPCSAPLGMRLGHYDPTLTFDLWASSGDVSVVRLNSNSAWEPRGEKDFILIKTSRPVVLTAMQTQGSPDSPDRVNGWVLETSLNCKDYHHETYTSGIQISKNTFVTDLKHPAFASCIQIRPTSFVGNKPALRLELQGCVISQHSSTGCSKGVEYDEYHVENGLEIYFGQEKVLAWLQVHLHQQSSRDTGTVYIFYSRLCDGEDWNYVDPTEIDVAFVPSDASNSIWLQQELHTPVRANCLRVISDTSSSVKDVLTNDCGSSPLPRVNELSGLPKARETVQQDEEFQKLGKNRNASLSLEKLIMGIFDGSLNGIETDDENIAQSESDSHNTSEILSKNRTPQDTTEKHNSFSDPLQQIMFSRHLKEKSSLSSSHEQTIDYDLHYDNVTKNISNLFQEFDDEMALDQSNDEILSTDWTSTLSKINEREENLSSTELSAQGVEKITPLDSLPNESSADLPRAQSSQPSSQDLRYILEKQSNGTNLSHQDNVAHAPVAYQDLFESQDVEIKPPQALKRTGNPSSEKRWINKKAKKGLKTLSLRKERKNLGDSSGKGARRCGVKSHHEGSRWKRVIAGEPNTLGQWPWLVSLHYLPFFSFTNESGYKHLCGGSLISPEWIVTAAHCFEYIMHPGLENISNWEVKIGINDLAGEQDTPGSLQERRIQALYRHPDYIVPISEYENDIALLKLDKPVHFSDTVSTICLLDTFEDVARHCLVTGWGKLTQDTPGARFAHTASIQTKTLRDCNATFESLEDGHDAKIFFKRISERVLCTQVGSNGEDSCQGDSGSPLMCEKKGRWYLTGIVSAGFECGNPKVPAICTRISHYVDWIKDITKLDLTEENDQQSGSESGRSGARPSF